MEKVCLFTVRLKTTFRSPMLTFPICIYVMKRLECCNLTHTFLEGLIPTLYKFFLLFLSHPPTRKKEYRAVMKLLQCHHNL